MKRLLSGAETALPPARAAPHHPQQHDASWHIEPQRPRTPPTLGSRLDDDLELPFQRGEADLVGKLGDPHQPHAQAAGFLCSAQVASTTGRQPLPARIDELQGSHRPQPPPALRERLPATDAHRAALVACHHGGANQHQGPSPLKSLHLPPAPPCARALQNTQGSRGQGVRSTSWRSAAEPQATSAGTPCYAFWRDVFSPGTPLLIPELGALRRHCLRIRSRCPATRLFRSLRPPGEQRGTRLAPVSPVVLAFSSASR